MIDDIAKLTPLEWTVVVLATAIALLGALLPKIGNLLGRLFLGEDPLLARWAHARAERRKKVEARVSARREARRARKLGARSDSSDGAPT